MTVDDLVGFVKEKGWVREGQGPEGSEHGMIGVINKVLGCM